MTLVTADRASTHAGVTWATGPRAVRRVDAHQGRCLPVRPASRAEDRRLRDRIVHHNPEWTEGAARRCSPADFTACAHPCCEDDVLYRVTIVRVGFHRFPPSS